MQCCKRSLSNFLLLVNNVNISKKLKNGSNFVVAVYCYHLV